MKLRHIHRFATLLGCATLLSAQAEMPVGDAERGREVFAACRTCHYPEKYVGNHNGPSLFNVFGRKAGSTDFAYYSKTMKASNLVWTPELLDFWLANPRTFLKGSTMVTVPMPNPQDRADLIAYLKQFKE
ncbi:MAG: c-type cytochrome [Proteobacteria bacterium]|nr:c-type cytochrome [Pseudomonadota bacterium]HQR02905.1 c-type cytochrome [Rhodocyclaceae bacterium]